MADAIALLAKENLLTCNYSFFIGIEFSPYLFNLIFNYWRPTIRFSGIMQVQALFFSNKPQFFNHKKGDTVRYNLF